VIAMSTIAMQSLKYVVNGDWSQMMD